MLDLGCGFGHHCRWMREQGAASVVGVDLSERMLEHARAMTSDSAIEYRCCAIEDRNLAPAGFDLVTSLLPLPAMADGKTDRLFVDLVTDESALATASLRLRHGSSHLESYRERQVLSSTFRKTHSRLTTTPSHSGPFAERRSAVVKSGCEQSDRCTPDRILSGA